MIYKVGDKVKVRSDLRERERYGNDDVTADMLKLCGKAVEIAKVNEDVRKYRIKESSWSWTDEMFEGLAKEESKLYASEFMELARKNPKEYEGKRYRVVSACVIEPSGKKEMYEVKVNNRGQLVCGDNDNWAYVNVHTQLEEIKPEPKPVSFMEAVKAYENGKMIWCEINGSKIEYKPFYGMLKLPNGNAVTAKQILHGTWFIKD